MKKSTIIGFVILILLAICTLVVVWIKKPQEAAVVPESTSPSAAVSDACPDLGGKHVRLAGLIASNSHTPIAQVYFREIPTEYNNFNFDESVTCRLPFSKMIVFGPFHDKESVYEYNPGLFAVADTWENYRADRASKGDYVTNVFVVQKTPDRITLIEVYQE